MSSLDKGYSEKRNFIRMKISAPLNAKLSLSEGVIEGTCRDLSGGGMQVETSTEIPVGTELLVEVSSEHGHSPTLSARAKAARCAANGEQGFTVGLEMIEVFK